MIYEAVPEDVYKKVIEVKESYFPELEDARIKVLFDTRPKKKSFLAKIYKASELLRFFTGDLVQEEEGLDYVIVFDQRAYQNEGISDDDRMRLIRHELRHIYYRPDKPKRKSQFTLRKHSVTDFYEELDLAAEEGDPRWMQRVQETIHDMYEMEEEEGE
jgi:predicted metallopeptidase